jgi:hypothetical protein
LCQALAAASVAPLQWLSRLGSPPCLLLAAQASLPLQALGPWPPASPALATSSAASLALLLPSLQLQMVVQAMHGQGHPRRPLGLVRAQVVQPFPGPRPSRLAWARWGTAGQAGPPFPPPRLPG